LSKYSTELLSRESDGNTVTGPASYLNRPQ
jgi:hypothetical protein